jgi:hypothetical protein
MIEFVVKLPVAFTLRICIDWLVKEFPVIDEIERDPPAFVIFVEPSVIEDRPGDGVKLSIERLEV